MNRRIILRVLLVIIVLTCGIYFVIYHYGLATKYNYFTAQRDLGRGEVNFTTVGFVLGPDIEEIDSLARKYRFGNIWLGCVASEEEINGLYYYNNAVEDYLNKVNKPGWRKEYDRKIDSLQEVAMAHIASIQNCYGCKCTFDTAFGSAVFVETTISPAFPGGPATWQRFLIKTIQYPGKEIADSTFQSTTVATFIVDSSGVISHIGIKRKETMHWTPFEGELVRVLRKSPGWKPAECNGRKVSAYHEQKIQIHLEL